MTVKTNDLKKGTRVQLSQYSHNGWYGTMEDNMRGDTRLVEVEGWFTEIGSVYSHDIIRAMINDEWVLVEHTPKQLKLKKQLTEMGW